MPIERIDCRSGRRVCQTAVAQLWCAGAAAGARAALDRPVLVGPSRQVVHARRRSATGPRAERDWGTAAAVTAAVLAGAHIVRVHAVAEMVQVVRVAEEIREDMAKG